MNVGISSFGKLILVVLLLVTGWTETHARSDAELLANYRLSMTTVKKMGLAADNLAALGDAGAVADQDDEDESEDDSPESIADIAAKYRANPAMRQAIEKTGLSVDEFALCLMSLLQSAMTVAMVQYLPESERAAAITRSGTAQDNIRFYREHRALVDSLGSKLQQLNN